MRAEKVSAQFAALTPLTLFALHAALWDYAQKNGVVIEGLKKPVNDIEELHNMEEE